MKPYGVPEVWLFKKSVLQIYDLQEDTYHPQSASRYFPAVTLPALIT